MSSKHGPPEVEDALAEAIVLDSLLGVGEFPLSDIKYMGYHAKASPSEPRLGATSPSHIFQVTGDRPDQQYLIGVDRHKKVKVLKRFAPYPKKIPQITDGVPIFYFTGKWVDPAKKNPAPVVVAAIIQAFLPLIISLGTKQINAYKKASTEDQIKMLKKWSMFLSMPARLALQNKKFARKIATTLSDILNDPETMDNLKEAGKAGIEVGQAYKGAKAKKNPTKAASRRAKGRRGKEKFVKLDAGHPDWSRGWTEEFEVKATSVAEAKKKARAQGYIVRYAEDHGMMMRHIDKLEKERQLAYAQAGLDLTDANVRKEAREQGWEQFPTKEKFGRRFLAKKNGPTLGKPHYPFAEKEKQYAKYTTSHLYHAMNDAMSASKIQQGWNEAGSNRYMDDYHTIIKEIQRRKGRG